MDVPSQETVGLLSSDEGGAGGSSDSPDSSEDEVTSHVPPAMTARAQVVVPTISVTPHSPGVLDDSLQQLRQLHAAVQRMRAAPLPLMVSVASLYQQPRRQCRPSASRRTARACSTTAYNSYASSMRPCNVCAPRRSRLW
ncbi:uncharacterized protein LOC134673043 [Cydia fagiglandana]|uniref:uncharacterized protein LOC134673043 n=1 Tax=Cydia fagiglandana TaxID=1458189 RepID=UPI002FEE6097